MKVRRLWLLAGLLSIVVAALVRLPHDVLSLQGLKQVQAHWMVQVQAQPLTMALAYFAAYLVVALLYLPGVALVNVVAGALFGMGWGLVLASFASTLAATAAFWMARYLLRDWVQAHFAGRLRAFQDGVAQRGGLFLLSLRLVPFMPYLSINLFMGLTRMRSWVFYGVSQLGMLPSTVLYVNAGTQLARVQSLSDVASPSVLASLVALAAFPWLLRLGQRRLRV
jgi:uncharacterized membrane protein YdjX (TVP38/TMEM64 family)